MKKLSILEITMIPVLVAITIVVKIQFAAIPNIELTTPLFIAITLLLKRHLSVYYIVLFLIVDSLQTQKGNVTFMLINAVVWIGILLFVQGIKFIKAFRPFTVFVVGFVSVLWQTAIWLLILPILSPMPGFSFSIQALLGAWSLDLASFHPIISGAVAVTLYSMLLEVIKASKIREVFDKA